MSLSKTDLEFLEEITAKINIGHYNTNRLFAIMTKLWQDHNKFMQQKQAQAALRAEEK